MEAPSIVRQLHPPKVPGQFHGVHGRKASPALANITVWVPSHIAHCKRVAATRSTQRATIQAVTGWQAAVASPHCKAAEGEVTAASHIRPLHGRRSPARPAGMLTTRAARKQAQEPPVAVNGRDKSGSSTHDTTA